MPPSSSKIAVAQMDCSLGDVKANLSRIEEIAADISKRTENVELVCFPELATTGYSLGKRWMNLSEPIPGESTDVIKRIASDNGFYIICGIDEKDEKTGKIHDSSVLIDPAGRIVGTYRKVHLWDKETDYFTPGAEFPVYSTKLGKIGLGICYDIEFPEPSRIMAKKGAQILVYSSAEMKPMENHIDTYVKARSAENCVFVAFSNRVGIEGKTVFFGRSQIASPACKVISKAKLKEKFAIARISLKDLDKERVKLPYLRDLAPLAYKGLA